MDWRLVYFVLSGALLSVALAQTRQYYFVSTQLNWTDAQSVCKQNFTDLATIENTDDVYAVLNTTFNFTGKAWIGLYDDLLNSWRWSLNDSSFYGEGETTFRNWGDGEPDHLEGKQLCVRLLSGSTYNGKWYDHKCSESHRFVCYNGTVNGSPSFVFNETRSLKWTEAQRFCRENYVDLASVRNQSENDNISTLVRGHFVWIGLYRQRLWSDGSSSLFRHWAAKEPNHGDHNCVAASFNDSGRWSDENCTQSLPFICYRPIPVNADSFRASGQNETSITLQWNKLEGNVSFLLQFNGTETPISPPDGDGPVNHTVSSLTAGSKYTFTLFSVLENVRSSGLQLTAATAPVNADRFRASGQNETSITLQWNKLEGNVSFLLQFNGTETPISPPDGDGPVNHTVSSLSAGSKYTFTLFSVFENVRSSGHQLTAATSPVNADSFRASGQNETSITLQLNKLEGNVSFLLQFNGKETHISPPDGDGPVNHTVSSLTAGSKYTFTLFSVFENVRSSGLQLTAATDYVLLLNIKLQSSTELTKSQLEKELEEIDFVRR
ncbi:uncharacterized protein ACNS7B_021144 [Menidia menidia]